MDFLWHKVSEKEKEEIGRRAKEIMDDFSSKLARVDKKIRESVIEREICERRESEGKCAEINREIFFENAPETKGDFIVAEKRKW